MARTPGPLPRAILFDLDDTLFDHSYSCRAAIGGLRRERAFLRRRPLDELFQLYARRLSDDWEAVLARRMSVEDARTSRWEKLAEACGERLSRSDARRVSGEYRALYQASRRPVPGALDLLRRWHGRAVIAIVTNNELAEQEGKLRFLGVEHLVDHLVVSETAGVSKPDPGIFRIALELAGVAPEEAVMIGDSWASDVLGAIAAGVRPVWFNRFHYPRPGPEPAAEVDRLRPAGRLESIVRPPPAHAELGRSGRIISRPSVRR